MNKRFLLILLIIFPIISFASEVKTTTPSRSKWLRQRMQKNKELLAKYTAAQKKKEAQESRKKKGEPKVVPSKAKVSTGRRSRWLRKRMETNKELLAKYTAAQKKKEVQESRKKKEEPKVATKIKISSGRRSRWLHQRMEKNKQLLAKYTEAKKKEEKLKSKQSS